MTKNNITVETTINRPIETVWKLWTTPAHMKQWNNPTNDWHTPKAEVDLRKGGSFFLRMEKKDGSAGFDHTGHYDEVVLNELIEYTVNDGRKSIIRFTSSGDATKLVETFEPESKTPLDLQKEFVQGVLDNFKIYAEQVGK